MHNIFPEKDLWGLFFFMAFNSKTYIHRHYIDTTLTCQTIMQEHIIVKVADYSEIHKRLDPRVARQHCYKKKAASIGQDGRLSACRNLTYKTMRYHKSNPLMNLVNTTLS